MMTQTQLDSWWNSLTSNRPTSDYTSQRNQAEQLTRSVVGSSMNVTRRGYGNGPTSVAHGENRAIDYTSSAQTLAERNNEALRVSAANGRRVNVIVETPIGHTGGRSTIVGPTPTGMTESLSERSTSRHGPRGITRTCKSTGSVSTNSGSGATHSRPSE